MKTKLKDNKIFRWIIIPLCICMCLFGRFIPTNNSDFSSDALGVIFIFVASIVLWLTIGIDWPSLLCLFSLGLIDKIGFKEVFSQSFGNATFIFLIFTFVCTYALSKTSLIKRIALFFIDNKLAKKGGGWFIFLFLLSVLILGLFISPTVLFVIILPILNEIFKIGNIDKKSKIVKFLMMGLGFSVSISSGMTPIAHVFPILAINALPASLSVTPLEYMLIAIPTGLVLFLIMTLTFILLSRKEKNLFTNLDLSSVKQDLPKINKKDIISLVIFIIVIILWIVPSFFKDVLPSVYKLINGWTTAFPPILGTILLCIIRVNNEPIIKIDDAFKNGIPWGSIIMCAATLVLGAALTSNSIGIKTYLENNLSNVLSTLSPIVLLIIFALWAALQTNLSSNMVTATLVASVAVSVVSLVSNINMCALVCIIGMLASFAFATPPSMPHIAIVAGSEYCSTRDVLLYGGLLMLISVVLALIIGYPIGTLLF